jgi:hypothetical protein
MPTITQPSVKSLFIEINCSGQTLATGTGFIVNTRRGPALVTNRHNVTGRHQETGDPLSPTGGIPNYINIIHNCRSGLGTWVPRIEPLYQDDRPRWIEHPALGAEADFVALTLTQLLEVQTYPYDPANTGTEILVGPADPLSVVGFPFGISGGGALAVWATGFMASEPEVNFSGLPVFLINCRSRRGQSGSPVIAYRSGGMVALANGNTAAFSGPVYRFLGIYSGRINSESDLGLVWKASAIRELIESI